ncbi:hypothetical protein EVAR_58994_1 [Eumeta japonica]|uniref:Uncharacterized protein n=1 Tax=Eumeta variegata TaxID=151549 RepID=A0A4C1ZM44_EUMVA|nr:hypothetical protein EVAR_58994_1 [Eumeta japonica]
MQRQELCLGYLPDKISNKEFRRKTKVTDTAHGISQLKWQGIDPNAIFTRHLIRRNGASPTMDSASFSHDTFLLMEMRVRNGYSPRRLKSSIGSRTPRRRKPPPAAVRRNDGSAAVSRQNRRERFNRSCRYGV